MELDTVGIQLLVSLDRNIVTDNIGIHSSQISSVLPVQHLHNYSASSSSTNMILSAHAGMVTVGDGVGIGVGLRETGMDDGANEKVVEG